MLKNQNATGCTDYTSTIDKLSNGKVAISDLYAADDDDTALELDPDVLIKVLELYHAVTSTCSQEIIITFDKNLQNPCIETVPQ